MGGLRKEYRNRKSPGRPAKPVDWELVDSLLLAGCNGVEIASHFDMHEATFYEKVQEKHKMLFTAYALEKKSKGDSLLRKVQFSKALKGDNTMLVWLGKNRLSQREGQDPNPLPPNDQNLTTLIAEVKELKGKMEKTDDKRNETIPTLE